MKLILVRHGETEWNRQKRIQGCRSDTRLNQRGLEQAGMLAAALQKERIDAIYSSPLKRAVETAQVIAEACGLQDRITNELREIDAGEIDGLFEHELTGRYEVAWKEFCSGNVSDPLPGGESIQDLQRRTSWAIARIQEKHIDGVVVVVAHLLTNMVIICDALGIGLNHVMRLKQDTAAISILELTTRGNSLLLFNDTCHLRA